MGTRAVHEKVECEREEAKQTYENDQWRDCVGRSYVVGYGKPAEEKKLSYTTGAYLNTK